MDENLSNELQELKNLQDSGSLDESQESRLTILNKLDETEKTAAQKSKDLESALAQKEHFRKKFEETQQKPEPPKEPDKEPQMSTAEIVALSKADIHADDIQEVLDYSKFKKISIAEALKREDVKAILQVRNEQRKSEEVSNTNTTRKSSPKPSDNEIITKADKGELPDDPSELIEARLREKLKGRGISV
jgi:DNA polymerase III alpha subunit